MSPEELKGMNGRRALVEAKICDKFPDRNGLVGMLFSEEQSHSILVPHSAIREILPEEIGEGDRVRVSESAFYKFREAHVVAISAPRAWVECPSGGQHFALLSDLTLIEKAGS